MRDLVEPGLSQLIRPTPVAAFLAEHWQAKPMVIHRQDPNYFAHLVSIDEVAAVMTTADLPSAAIDLANADSQIERDEFVGASGAVDIVKTQQLFSQGATILLNEAHKRIPALGLLCRALERDFSAPFQANIYMTPAGSKGFRPHYDTHDVFLLQISGSKDWTICGNPVALPLPSQPFDAARHAVEPTTLACRLEPGDVLYVPRGYIHHARSAEEISLHVTLGALVYTWGDAIREAVSELSLADEAFRRALPVDFAKAQFDFGSAMRTFATLIDSAKHPSILRTVLERLADAFVVSRPPLVPRQFQQLANLKDLSPWHEAGPRPGLIYRLQASGDSLKLLCHGREITLPAMAADAARFALERPRYVIRDIEGDLDDEGKLALIRRLVEEGVVMWYTRELT